MACDLSLRTEGFAQDRIPEVALPEYFAAAAQPLGAFHMRPDRVKFTQREESGNLTHDAIQHCAAASACPRDKQNLCLLVSQPELAILSLQGSTTYVTALSSVSSM